MQTLTFQTETCGRCHGSGRMPYAAYGGVCFGCHGKGQRLTAAGRRASEAFDAAILERNGVPAQQVRVGDVVISRASKYMTEYALRARTVLEITEETYKRRVAGAEQWEWVTVTAYVLGFGDGKYATYEHDKPVRMQNAQGAQEVREMIAKRFRKGATLTQDEPQQVAA